MATSYPRRRAVDKKICDGCLHEYNNAPGCKRCEIDRATYWEQRKLKGPMWNGIDLGDVLRHSCRTSISQKLEDIYSWEFAVSIPRSSPD